MLWLAIGWAAASDITQQDVDAYGESLEEVIRAGCTPATIAPLMAQELDDAGERLRGWLTRGMCLLWVDADAEQAYVPGESDPERGALMRVPMTGSSLGKERTFESSERWLQGYLNASANPRLFPRRDWIQYYRLELGRREGRVVATEIHAVHLGQSTSELVRSLLVPLDRTEGQEPDADVVRLQEARVWLHSRRPPVDMARDWAWPANPWWFGRGVRSVTCSTEACGFGSLRGSRRQRARHARVALSKHLLPRAESPDPPLAVVLESLRAATPLSHAQLAKVVSIAESTFPGHEGVALGIVNAHLARRDFVAALRAMDALHDALPEEPFIHVLRGEVSLSLGRGGEANKWLAKAVEQAPQMLRPYWMMIQYGVMADDDERVAHWITLLRTAHPDVVTERTLRRNAFLDDFMRSPEAERMLSRWRTLRN